MSCSPFDLRDFFLQELPPTERLQVEAHVKTCVPCREELDRLQLTGRPGAGLSGRQTGRRRQQCQADHQGVNASHRAFNFLEFRREQIQSTRTDNPLHRLYNQKAV